MVTLIQKFESNFQRGRIMSSNALKIELPFSLSEDEAKLFLFIKAL
jgi:hypothetical protein